MALIYRITLDTILANYNQLFMIKFTCSEFRRAPVH